MIRVHHFCRLSRKAIRRQNKRRPSCQEVALWVHSVDLKVKSRRVLKWIVLTRSLISSPINRTLRQMRGKKKTSYKRDNESKIILIVKKSNNWLIRLNNWLCSRKLLTMISMKASLRAQKESTLSGLRKRCAILADLSSTLMKEESS